MTNDPYACNLLKELLPNITKKYFVNTGLEASPFSDKLYFGDIEMYLRKILFRINIKSRNLTPVEDFVKVSVDVYELRGVFSNSAHLTKQYSITNIKDLGDELCNKYKELLKDTFEYRSKEAHKRYEEQLDIDNKETITYTNKLINYIRKASNV